MKRSLGRCVTEAFVVAIEITVVNLSGNNAAFTALAGQVELTANFTKAASTGINAIADMLICNSFAKTNVHTGFDLGQSFSE